MRMISTLLVAGVVWFGTLPLGHAEEPVKQEAAPTAGRSNVMRRIAELAARSTAEINKGSTPTQTRKHVARKQSDLFERIRLLARGAGPDSANHAATPDTGDQSPSLETVIAAKPIPESTATSDPPALPLLTEPAADSETSDAAASPLHPEPAVDWTLVDHRGQQHSMKQFLGKPLLIIFYQGLGCLHCAEQLERFAEKSQDFEDAGASLIAVSTDDLKLLKESQANYDGTFPFPIVSDPGLEVFKAYDVYDDSEDKPLHGTFLIDGEGAIRWQHVGREPFMEPDVVLEKAKRFADRQHAIP